MAFTGALIIGCALVLLRGSRAGIERASKVLIPALFLSLLVLMIRAWARCSPYWPSAGA